MSKHYLSKSALALSLIAASLASASLVQADESATETQPVAASALESQSTATTSDTVTSEVPSSEEVVPAETAVAETVDSPEVNTPTSNPVTDTTVTAPVEGQTVDIRIASTTDLHTNLVNYDYYQDKESQNIGLAKTAILLEEAKTENPNIVTVDNGDLIQGTPLGTYKAIVDKVEPGEQHPMYAALEALGFDASTLGNHEFNYGLDYLKTVLKTADIPVINANVRDAKTNEFVFKPYVVTTKNVTDTAGKVVTLKIGITGIVPPQIMNWDKANLEGKVVVQDAVEAVEAIIPAMREAGADLILVLSHSGIGDDKYDKGEENVGYQIASLPGVDAVVTGHSHAEFPSGNGTGFYEKYTGVDGVRGLINGTPVTMAGKYGDHLGIIDLNLTYTDGKWTVNKDKSLASIRKIDTKSTKADQTVIAIAKEAHNGTIQYVRQQVGTTTAPITSYFALVKDDPSVQIVNKAQLWYGKQELAGTPYAKLPLLSAAAPFKAGTRNDPTAYTDIPAGPIAIKNVADLYLYDNVTAILKITGSDLKEWLEMSAGQFNTIDPNNKEPQNLVNTDYRTYNFDVIDGVTYEYDITQPNKYDRNGNLVNANASRVRNLKYNGNPVTDDQEFMVVTNNYRASGTFPGVKNASVNYLFNLENRQAIINYIISEKTINPSADSNWYFTDSIAGLDLRFLSAEKAKDLVGDAKDISYLGASNIEGFAEFKFTYMKPVEDPSVKKPVPPTDTKRNSGLSDKDRTDIHQLVATNYQAQQRKAPAKDPIQTDALPKTGEDHSAVLTLFGFSILAGLTSLLRRKES